MTASTNNGPKIETRSEQPCLAIPISVPMKDWGKAVALVDDIFGWLDQKGIPPAGPLFFRYLTIGDMEKPFDLEVGVPVVEPIEGDDRVVTGSVPAGTYATLVHHGHPDKLYDSCAALEEWAERKGVTFQTSVENDKSVWGGRFEFYLTNPAEQPDMSKWSTEVAYLVAS
jgi:effector-binding domain-containing protein